MCARVRVKQENLSKSVQPVQNGTEHFMDRSVRSGRKYPLSDMAVGDWFSLPSLYVDVLNASAGRYAQKGIRFSLRKQDDGTHICTRVK